MYQYDAYDHRPVAGRVAQFRNQVRRRVPDELTEGEFLPLHPQDGLHYQCHAYILRVAIPYGHLRAKQLRMLSHITTKYDRGYGRFNTRQGIQYNWIELGRVPDILAKLASVEMHAIQTSGNCIRNVTTDQFAGVAPDEVIDIRPLTEILRQWSTLIPGFAFLPRKFKIIMSASRDDCAVTQLHDIGVYAYGEDGQTLLHILTGGSMGHAPILGTVIKEGLPWQHMLSCIKTTVRAYNRYDRRDNKHRARIKTLVKTIGAEEFARQVEEEWQRIKGGPSTITQTEFNRVAQFFTPPAYKKLAGTDAAYEKALLGNKAFARQVSRNVHPYRVPGYTVVTLSLEPGAALPPGDATTEQVALVADWSERFDFGEVRVAREQDLILPDVKKHSLLELWQLAKEHGMAVADIGLLTDIIACPGGNFCSSTNAKSIPIAQAIQVRFDDLDYVHDLGELSLNISGYVNSYGHHHVGNISTLGVDKHEEEWCQVSLGDAQGNDSAIGKVIGPSFKAEEMPDVIGRITGTFVVNRTEDERFIDTYHRTGMALSKERVYAHAET